MQNPFRTSEEDEVDYARMLSGMEIGTEATRAAIIDKATKRRVNAQQAQQMLLVFFMR